MNKIRSRILGGLVGALLAVGCGVGLLFFLNSGVFSTSKDADSSSPAQTAAAPEQTTQPAQEVSSAEEAHAESEPEKEPEPEKTLEIELKKKSYTYTGSEITPKFTVLLDGKELDEGDFETSLSNNTEVGKASLTVTSGDLSASKSFSIVPAAPKISKSYTSTASSVTISWEPAEQAQYYSISKYTDMTDAEKKAAGKTDEDEENRNKDENGETIKPAHCGKADADESTYTDKTVQSGMVYRYVIRSCAKVGNKNYDSGFSKELTAVTLPDKPGMPTLSADKKTIVWTPSAKCDGYEVLMAESGKELKSTAETDKTSASFTAKSMVTVVIRAYIECDGKKYYSLQSDPALLEPAAAPPETTAAEAEAPAEG